MADPQPKPAAHDTEEFRKAVNEGLKSLEEGRSTPYEKVREWLLSWGTAQELPPPK